MVSVYISVKMGYFLKNFVVTLFFSWCITRCYVLTAIATVVFLRAELESAVLSYLPSQQMWEYLLTRILSVAVLLGSIISRCMTVFVYPFFSLLFFKIQNNKTVEICWNDRERVLRRCSVSFYSCPLKGKGLRNIELSKRIIIDQKCAVNICCHFSYWVATMQSIIRQAHTACQDCKHCKSKIDTICLCSDSCQKNSTLSEQFISFRVRFYDYHFLNKRKSCKTTSFMWHFDWT